jgi:hypothetical protein
MVVVSEVSVSRHRLAVFGFIGFVVLIDTALLFPEGHRVTFSKPAMWVAKRAPKAAWRPPINVAKRAAQSRWFRE